MNLDKSAEVALREASDLFHQILSALTARRFLTSGKPLTEPMRVEFVKRAIDQEAIEKLAADGFERCVLALHALGAEDVTIHECSPTEEEH